METLKLLNDDESEPHKTPLNKNSQTNPRHRLGNSVSHRQAINDQQ